MSKYDTLLYGNGLSIAIYKKLHEKYSFQDFNDYLIDFLFDKTSDKFEFYNILKSNMHSFIYIEQPGIKEIEDYLCRNIEEVNKKGYEVWVGNEVMKYQDCFNKDVALYYIALFNYWYEHYIIIHKDMFDNVIREVYSIINNSGINNIYTLNYDTLLDNYLDVKHVHGKFVLPFNDLENHIEYFNNRKNYINKLCVATNGLEKLTGLANLQSLKSNNYDYSFLFDDKLGFGDLLIYGIRFADSLIIPDEIKRKYTDEEIDLLMYVDGHIIERLDVLYLNHRVDSITICYYGEEELERYKRIFGRRKCSKIIKYIPSKEIY